MQFGLVAIVIAHMIKVKNNYPVVYWHWYDINVFYRISCVEARVHGDLRKEWRNVLILRKR